MKIGICGDIHWSTYSSILRNRGKNFSLRLEGLIKSLSWVEQIIKEQGCAEEIFLGDTFDKPDLTAEEISALSEVEWNNNSRLKHFIVGNHESGVSSLIYNSTQTLHKVGVVEDKPYLYPLDDKTELLFLPYITEDDRKPLVEYLTNRNNNKKLIICSHNDIKGFQMGAFLSKTGFEVDEINKNCDLYLNGHLHNCGKVNDKIINIGVLTGQNFSEDAFKYDHHIAVLDTETMTLEYFENPYAFNFYKIAIDKESDINDLNKLKNNAIVSLKCLCGFEDKVKEILENSKKIINYRVMIERNDTFEYDGELQDLNNIDHLKQFQEFILERQPDIGDINVVKEELVEVCK